MVLKIFEFFLFFYHFNVLMSKIKKNIISMYFQVKNTLKNNFYANTNTVFGKREWEKDVQE
jgi:hypothetical protein